MSFYLKKLFQYICYVPIKTILELDLNHISDQSILIDSLRYIKKYTRQIILVSEW